MWLINSFFSFLCLNFFLGIRTSQFLRTLSSSTPRQTVLKKWHGPSTVLMISFICILGWSLVFGIIIELLKWPSGSIWYLTCTTCMTCSTTHPPPHGSHLFWPHTVPRVPHLVRGGTRLVPLVNSPPSPQHAVDHWSSQTHAITPQSWASRSPSELRFSFSTSWPLLRSTTARTNGADKTWPLRPPPSARPRPMTSATRPPPSQGVTKMRGPCATLSV